MPYMDSSDSDGDSEGEIISLRGCTEEIYKHHRLCRDAVHGTVTTRTKLIPLYDPSSTTLLKDCNDTAGPAQRCQIMLEDGRVFPPKTVNGDSRYYLYHTNYKLNTAPQDRLECRFFSSKKLSATPDFTVAVHFHFNDYKGKDTGIKEYNFQELPGGDAILTFTAGPATSEYFTLTALHEHEFGHEEREILKLLKSYTNSAERRSVKLHLHQQMFSASDLHRLRQLRDRLPGGHGKLLPSFGRREYEPFLGCHATVPNHKDALRIGPSLMGVFKHPLTPQECGHVLATVDEWAAQTSIAAVTSDFETNESLQLWAKTKHRCRLYDCDKRAILAVRFEDHDTLPGATARFKISGQLSVGMKFKSKRQPKTIYSCEGYLVPNTFSLPYHHAFFLITSHRLDYFKKAGVVWDRKIPPRDDNGDWVQFNPHHASFTTNSQLATIAAMQKNKRWHQILLCQDFDGLEDVDLTKGINPELVKNADSKLFEDIEWNEEQLAPIRGPRSMKGGMMLMMGPAGTGKTLVLLKLTQWCYDLGFHVIFAAPANSNVDDFSVKLYQKMMQDSELRAVRVFPKSQEIGLEKLSEQQAASKKVGHTKGEVCSIDELTIAVEHMKLGKAQIVPGLEDTVLKVAKEKKEKCEVHLKECEDVISGKVDAWQELRDYLNLKHSGKLVIEPNPENKASISEKNMRAMAAKKRGEAAYRACKRHVLGRSRFVITTLGNVRCTELMENWFVNEEWAAPRKGVVVIVDEAPKALEVDAWAPVVCETWTPWVKGVILAGDDKQLAPVNTCLQGKIKYNPFNGRLNTALTERLIGTAFPCHRLKEQRRMHPAISNFPNHHFYNGILRDGPGTNVPLESVLPRFSLCLKDILTCRIYGYERKKQLLEKMTDEHLRLQWLQVKGIRTKNEISYSSNVPEHIEVFFDKVLPRLRKYFKDGKMNMAEHVMIICAYGEAISKYNSAFKNAVRDKVMTVDHVPRVLTVDSSQGQEADMVIFDGSCQENEVIGFLEDPRRCNVAVTRAKHVFWMLGGAMAMGPKKEKFHLTMYKEKCDREGRTVVMN